MSTRDRMLLLRISGVSGTGGYFFLEIIMYLHFLGFNVRKLSIDQLSMLDISS